MKKIVSKDTIQQAMEIAEIISSYVAQKPNALLCLAAGDTPAATYQEMARLQQDGKANFRNCRLILLDEWVGLSAKDEGGCTNFIYDNVVSPLCIKEENIIAFDACSNNLDSECQAVNDYLSKNGPIDISLMGVGMNGHVALNEPGCSFDGVAHIVELDSITKNVAQKYFKNETPLSHGITLGMKQILDSKLLIVIANGSKKHDIMKKAVTGPVTSTVPASSLQLHKNCIVSLDSAANGEA